MDLGLEGRVALVLGGSRGLGEASAVALAAEGARVAIASRSSEKLRAARERHLEIAAALPVDTDDLDAVAALPGQVADALGPVDVLVANTGGPPQGPALEHDLAVYERAYRSLVLAPRVLIEAVVPGMRERGWGRIVNIGSTAALEPSGTLDLSTTHRLAAVGLFKTLARQLAPAGITLNTIATGTFATERIAETSGGSMDKAEQRARDTVPAGRLGRPDEFGALVAFLASERAAYLTGTVIPLDGGATRGL